MEQRQPPALIPYESETTKRQIRRAQNRAEVAAYLLLSALPRQQRRAQERKLKKAQEALARLHAARGY